MTTKHAVTKDALAQQLRLAADALLCACASELRRHRDAPYYGVGDSYWSEWAAEARASYELIGHGRSFWELGTYFGMVPAVMVKRGGAQ